MARFKWRKSQYWNGLDTGGGYMSYTELEDNVVENIHPDATDAERALGDIEYRAIFPHLISGTAENAIMCVGKTSESDDYYAIAHGLHWDTVEYASNAGSYPDSSWYMVGELVTAISSSDGVASFEADFDSNYGVQNAGIVALINWTTPSSLLDTYTVATSASSGVSWTDNRAKIKLASETVRYDYPVKAKGAVVGSNSEPFAGLDGTYLIVDANTVIHTIAFGSITTASDVVSYINSAFDAGDDHATAIATPSGQVTIENNRYYSNNYVQVTGGDARTILGFSTDASTSTDGTMVAGVLDLGDIETSTQSITVTSDYGSFDDDNYPIGTYNVGTVEEFWTLTFNTTIAYSVTGNRSGNVGATTISATFAPANQGSHYFLLQPASFNNSFVAGDTITFYTHPSAEKIWVKRVVPTGAASWGYNKSCYILQSEE